MSKISELSDGGSLQSTDYLIAVRSGGNVKVQADGNLSLGTVTADGLTVADTTGTVATFTSSGVTTALNMDNTHANGWGSNIAFKTGGTAAGYFGSIGSLLGNTDQDLSVYATAGNGVRVYTNGANERMRITSAGNVGIGTSSPAYNLVVSNGGASGIEFGPAYSGTANLIQHYNRSGAAYVDVVNDAAQHRFNISGTERMRIDSSGNLLVGKTSDNNAVAGTAISNSGIVKATRTDWSLLLNRLTTDGDLALFQKDGTTVGSIGTNSGDFYLGNGNTCLLFDDGSDLIRSANSSGGGRDGLTNLGNSSNRFKNLYLSGGVYLGGTGAANLLDDYETGTWTPSVAAGSISGTSITYTAKYVKVGDMVTFTFHANSTTGDIQVSSYVTFGGLPFTLSNNATSTVVTEDIDVFARQGFAVAGGTGLTLSACGSSSGTNDLVVSITAKISA